MSSHSRSAERKLQIKAQKDLLVMCVCLVYTQASLAMNKHATALESKRLYS